MQGDRNNAARVGNLELRVISVLYFEYTILKTRLASVLTTSHCLDPTVALACKDGLFFN